MTDQGFSRRAFLKKAAKVSAAASPLAVGLLSGCDDSLSVSPDSELSDEFLSTSDGINSVLMSAYDNIQYNSFIGVNKVYVAEWPTDIMWQTGGGQNRHATLYINYTWDPSHGWLDGFWSTSYGAIRDANIVLDNLEASEVSGDQQEMLQAEARFIRATSYFFLNNWFGPVPLITSSEQDNLEPERTSQEQIDEFISTEYSESASVLPSQRSADQKGRATKGAALAMLTKFFLNSKQWEECASTAQRVIDMGEYELHPDFFELFQVENENNDEFIWVHNAVQQPGEGNVFPPAAFPPQYPTSEFGPGQHENWAAQVRLLDNFVRSFADVDDRQELIITEYTDTEGNFVELLGNDNSRSFKYWPDPNANGRWTGNDIPEVRYSDILLSRAEALNEMEGPNQESIDLINAVRTRAGVEKMQLSDFSSASGLREHLLKERGWEFYHEGKRRQDMVRHEVFISNAQKRGKNAQSHHTLFPIPQSEIDTNPNIEQNMGY